MPEQATTREGFFGLKNAHIAWRKPDGTYEAPIPVPGIRSMKLSAQGGKNPNYADDGLWATTYSNQGFEGDVVFYAVPADIIAKMLGYEIDKNGAMLGITNGIPAEFALLAEEQSLSDHPRRTTYYSCTAARPDNEAKTKEDKVELKEQTYSITAAPITIGNRELDHATLTRTTENAAHYDAFFAKVYMPDQTNTPA